MKVPRMRFEGLTTFPIKLPDTRHSLERALELFGGAGLRCCVVTNMMDEVYGARRGKVETVFPVAARGKMR